MDINPQEVIKHLSNEIGRLNLELAILKTALEQAQNDGIQETAGEKSN